MAAFCKQILCINTKVTDFEEIKNMVKPVIEFANEKGISLSIGINDGDGKLYSECFVRGQFTRYCKALVADVKDMLRQTFHCKMDMISIRGEDERRCGRMKGFVAGLCVGIAVIGFELATGIEMSHGVRLLIVVPLATLAGILVAEK